MLIDGYRAFTQDKNRDIDFGWILEGKRSTSISVINWLMGIYERKKIWGILVSLFNGISTFVGYSMPKQFSLKNISGTI